MKTSLFFLVLLSLLAACSGPGGKTSASLKVTFGGLSVGGNPVTQIIITGQSTKGEKFARVLTDGTDTISLPLPNGSWNFLAMAWEGGVALEGKVRCAYSTASLDGSPTAIPLVMTNAKCFDGTLNMLTPDNTGSDPAFRITQMKACRIDIQSIVSPSENCNFNIADQNPRGAVIGSLKVGIQGGDQFGANFVPNNQFLGSGCENAGSYTAINQRFPAIKSTYFFPLVALGYPAAVCNPARGVVRATFANNTLRMIEDAPNFVSTYAQFTDSAICSAANANTTAINEIGMGTVGAPYGLCNLNQLRHWQENFSSHSGDNVALLANLDLLSWVKAGTVGTTPYHSCLKDGSTFLPLGASVDGSCNFLTIQYFGGTLHGLGHSISNFRFDSAEDDMGLFRAFSGSGSIRSLTLINPFVRGEDNVGAFVGNVSTGGALTWLNVVNGDVEGEGQVGLIAGIANSGSTKSGLHAQGKVYGEDDYIGGLIGQAGTDTISESSFAGEVITDSGESVGGIAGQAGGIVETVVSGYIQGANTVGGIAGQATTINDARVTATVIGTMDTGGTAHGGIVGIVASVERAMFFGSFYSNNTLGNSGIISSNTPGTNLDTFTIQTYSPIGTGSVANNSGTSASAIPVWTQVCDTATAWDCRDLNNDYVLDPGEGMDLPRLAFEDHPCMLQANLDSVALQQVAGRGTSANPIRLCRREQISEINTDATTRNLHYSLQQDIAINHITNAIVVSPNTFHGTFNGNGHAIHGFANPSASANYGLFGTLSNTAVVRNLKLYNFRFASASNGLSLFGNSSGLIENVQTKFIDLQAPGTVGGLVRTNFGTIRNAQFEGVIGADTAAGGIVSDNGGTIEDVVSNALMFANDGLSSGGTDANYGGIAGSNSGIIRRAQFDGRIESFLPTWDLKRLGGLVGANFNGSVTDSVVTTSAQLSLSSGLTEVGGLIGHLDTSSSGTVARLISQAIVKHPSIIATTNANFGSIAGGTSNPLSVATYYPLILPTANASAIYGGPGFMYSAGFCDSSSFTGISGLTDTFEYIAIASTDSFVPINMTFSAGDILSFEGSSQEDCDQANENFSLFYKTPAANNPLTFAQLSSTYSFNIVDYDNGTDTHKRPVFDAHLAAIRGQPAPSNKPVWIFEEGQYKLFRTDK